MATAQTELTTAQTEVTTEQTDLIEKLNCLEFETSQLNLAYQLWRSGVEQGTAPGWMDAAIRITYDALITFWLETVSTIQADVLHAFSASQPPPLEGAAGETSGIAGEESATAEPSSAELTTAQTELIEKLTCLEFEAAQLNRAYQLWRSCVEQGTAPDWMVAAIRISYDTLITFCLDTARHLAQSEAAGEISGIWEEESTTAELSPKLLPIMEQEQEPDWSGPEMPAAISPPSTGDTISEQPAIQQGQQEAYAFSARRLPQLEAAAGEMPGILEEESTTAEPSLELSPITELEPDCSAPEMPAAISRPSTGDAISDEQGQHEEEADVPRAFPAMRLAQLKAAACEISGILEEESTIAKPSPESLPVTEPEPKWSGPEMPAAISPLSTGDAISKRPAIQQGRQEEEAGAEPAAIHSLATLAKWLPESSTGIFFVVPPGALGRLLLAAFVAILIVVGGAIGIYRYSARRAAAVVPLQNSSSQAAAGAIATPNDEKAEFKFDPDPVVALPGRSFVLKAMLSRGSDIASVAVQIDYDASLLRFMGVSEGGVLAKDGHQVVLVQRDDPLTGVLRISAEKSPGNPAISGDGPFFSLSFQARKRGKATVSIVPGAHDSQGRRIEMAGSQVSVRVN